MFFVQFSIAHLARYRKTVKHAFRFATFRSNTFHHARDRLSVVEFPSLLKVVVRFLKRFMTARFRAFTLCRSQPRARDAFYLAELLLKRA
jgi:hypothetical protein